MARDVIILGAGRSGTSLLAGIFANSGYFVGDNLWPGTEANPRGYFEDVEINAINEDLLDDVVPWRPRGVMGALMPIHRDRPRWTQRWLSVLPPGTALRPTHEIDARIAAQTSRRPYLFKDPRFSYTLPAWLPHLSRSTVYTCVFRDPQRTVNSILRLRKQERYLRDLVITRERALEYWKAIYTSVFHLREQIGGDWLFVHYDELVTGRALPILSCCYDAKPDESMVETALARSGSLGEVDDESIRMFHRLLEEAERKYEE